MKYIERTMRPVLERLSTHYPVVTVYGPRQSGKTTLIQTAFPDLLVPYEIKSSQSIREDLA
ncbi:MAG: hypothetical protein WC117_02045 [Sphaerochaetaceae bacterium]|nr:hypothetical protein [Sphaerochaetaceae bacterium]